MVVQYNHHKRLHRQAISTGHPIRRPPFQPSTPRRIARPALALALITIGMRSKRPKPRPRPLIQTRRARALQAPRAAADHGELVQRQAADVQADVEDEEGRPGDDGEDSEDELLGAAG